MAVHDFPSSGADSIDDITGLQAALDAKAPTASPTFTGTVTASGAAYVMSGSPATAGNSVRNRHGNGGANDIYDNVPTGGTHALTVNGSTYFALSSSQLSTNVPHALTGSPASLGNSTRNRHGGGGTTDIVDNVSSSGGISWAQNGTTILGFDSAKAATVDATFAASLATALGAGAVTGSIAMWGTGSAPTGYLLCDGSAVSRSTYAALFALLSTTFGAGNGSTTFNLPDFRGRAPIGAGTGSGLTARTLAGTTGVESVTLTAAQSGLPAHTHSVPGGDTPNYASTAGKLSGTGTGGAVDTSSTGGSAASSSHDNMQPSLVVNFIIKT